MELNKANDFEQALRRMGWLNAYARQVLTTRYMLRQFSILSPEADALVLADDIDFLTAHRLAITVLSGANKKMKRFSSPYEPTNAPETHKLKHWRGRSFFEVSCASGAAEFRFLYASGSSMGFDHGDYEGLEDQLLAHEVFEIGKGVWTCHGLMPLL